MNKIENIDHRLTRPSTPKTNGMVERANGIIKSNTILREHYDTKEEMKTDLMKFLVFYLLYRRHGSLKKELGVKTPFEAVEKWFELKPEIFLQKPLEFKNKILLLHHQTKSKQELVLNSFQELVLNSFQELVLNSFQHCLTQQPCET